MGRVTCGFRAYQGVSVTIPRVLKDFRSVFGDFRREGLEVFEEISRTFQGIPSGLADFKVFEEVVFLEVSEAKGFLGVSSGVWAVVVLLGSGQCKPWNSLESSLRSAKTSLKIL